MATRFPVSLEVLKQESEDAYKECLKAWMWGRGSDEAWVRWGA